LTIATLGLVTSAFTLVAAPPAGADGRSSTAQVSTDEQDCRETNVVRAVLTSGLDPLVPDRYSLLRLGPSASRFVVTTYTCSRVSVDGQPAVGHDKSTTVTIGSAVVTSRDGQPLPASQQQYVVWYGTDNPVLFAKLQQTGLPVSFLHGSSATASADAGTTTIDWAIRGAGLDYVEQAVATDPPDEPGASTTTWWYDGPEGDLQITYANQLATSTAVVTADFTRNELLSEIIAQPALLTINGVRFGYARGSWTAEVRSVS
jgi:hypothetical protein